MLSPKESIYNKSLVFKSGLCGSLNKGNVKTISNKSAPIKHIVGTTKVITNPRSSTKMFIDN